MCIYMCIYITLNIYPHRVSVCEEGHDTGDGGAHGRVVHEEVVVDGHEGGRLHAPRDGRALQRLEAGAQRHEGAAAAAQHA